MSTSKKSAVNADAITDAIAMNGILRGLRNDIRACRPEKIVSISERIADVESELSAAYDAMDAATQIAYAEKVAQVNASNRAKFNDRRRVAQSRYVNSLLADAELAAVGGLSAMERHSTIEDLRRHAMAKNPAYAEQLPVELRMVSRLTYGVVVGGLTAMVYASEVVKGWKIGPSGESIPQFRTVYNVVTHDSKGEYHYVPSLANATLAAIKLYLAADLVADLAPNEDGVITIPNLLKVRIA
jgi:hypothetical protein